jgi:hypothetical protein
MCNRQKCVGLHPVKTLYSESLIAIDEYAVFPVAKVIYHEASRINVMLKYAALPEVVVACDHVNRSVHGDLIVLASEAIEKRSTGVGAMNLCERYCVSEYICAPCMLYSFV